MTQRSRADIQGLEYDWLASDADGYVAFFSTAGGGYAPDEFLVDTDLHDAAVQAILALPAGTEARYSPSLAATRQNTWRLMAERGLYAFDADPNGGPYRRVGAPVHPSRVKELPDVAVKAASRLVLATMRFAETSEVPAAALRPSGSS